VTRLAPHVSLCQVVCLITGVEFCAAVWFVSVWRLRRATSWFFGWLVFYTLLFGLVFVLEALITSLLPKFLAVIFTATAAQKSQASGSATRTLHAHRIILVPTGTAVVMQGTPVMAKAAPLHSDNESVPFHGIETCERVTGRCIRSTSLNLHFNSTRERWNEAGKRGQKAGTDCRYLQQIRGWGLAFQQIHEACIGRGSRTHLEYAWPCSARMRGSGTRINTA
jgi:hypothetical protein